MSEQIIKKIKADLTNFFAQEVSLSDMAGDVSARQYMRVALSKSDKNYVVCYSEDEKVHQRFIMVQELMMREEIDVPKIEKDFSKYDKRYLLQEDLGQVSLYNILADNQEDIISIYQKVIDQVVSFHKIGKDSIEDDLCELEFDEKKLMDEMEVSAQYLMKKYLNFSQQQIDQTLAAMRPLCRQLGEMCEVFVHRDLHCKNIMIHQGSPILIDFQDARWGVAPYDLASLLDDSYNRLPAEQKKILKKYYWQQAGEQIQSYYGNYQNFLKIYDMIAVQRLIKAMGSFAMVYYKRNDASYLKYIGTAAENLKSILHSREELYEVRETFLKGYYGA